MQLKHLGDKEILNDIQALVCNERELLTTILWHLLEVERRKLFSDLGCQSLFEYCVRELKYSEGQASRRIQAMRLLKEFPQVEEKISSGALSLTNISQAQSYFRESKKLDPSKEFQVEDKIEFLESLEHKSTREVQKIILQNGLPQSLPKEKVRMLDAHSDEIRCVVSQELKMELEEVRALLGLKGFNLSFVELIGEMAKISKETFRVKRFGKSLESRKVLEVEADRGTGIRTTPAPAKRYVKSARSISGRLRYQVWQRDGGKCTCCGSQRNLNYDHIQPVELGGKAEIDNLRLLCFHCNQRQSFKAFGVRES